MKRRLQAALFVLVPLLLLAPACSRDPRAAAAKHARQGDEYAGRELHREAALEYRNAVKLDPTDASVRLRLAMSLLATKDLPGGYQELRKAVELDPSNPEARERLGEIYVIAGKLDDASAIADNLMASRPADPAGFLLKAAVQNRRGESGKAIENLTHAASLAPGSARPLVAIGSVHLSRRDPAAAREWFEKAVAVQPDSAAAQVALGRFLFGEGRFEEGEKAYRSAIAVAREKDREGLRLSLAESFYAVDRLPEAERELNGLIRENRSQKARKMLAELKLEAGNPKEAAPLVEEILREDGTDHDGKYLKGRLALADRKPAEAKALFTEVARQDAANAKARLFGGIADVQLGRIEAGRKEVEEAVAADPSNLRARLVLADLHLRGGNPEGAEKEALEVLKRNRGSQGAAILLADSYLARKEYARAEQIYGSLLRQLPDHPAGHMKMGFSRRLQGKPGEAAKYFSRALELDPRDLAVLNEYVFALGASGERERAGKVLGEAVAKDPGNPFLREMEGRFLTAGRQFAAAEAAFLKAIELSPAYSAPYYRLGMLYAVQKKLPEAERNFRAVVEKEPGNGAARAILGVVLNGQGKIEEANREYRKALEISPRSPLPANNLAANLTDGKGNLDEALKFAQIAREAAPDDPYVADTLGWIHYRKGILASAHDLVSEAARKDRENPVVRYHLGMVLAAKGKGREAAGELRAALALDPRFPGNQEARKVLEGLP